MKTKLSEWIWIQFPNVRTISIIIQTQNMLNKLLNRQQKVALIGLGYVGLPIALEFARKMSVIGFDINNKRVQMMKNGIDP